MENAKFVVPKPYPYPGISQYQPPLSYELEGRALTLVMDGEGEWELEVSGREKAALKRAGAKEEYTYECLKIDDDTYLLNLKNARGAATLVLDLAQYLVTLQRVEKGAASGQIIFGAVKKESGFVPAARHAYTDDLVGRAVEWRFGSAQILHAYESERSIRCAVPDEEKQTLRQEMADYVKIKDGVYAVMIREKETGKNLFFLMNVDRMYTVGRVIGEKEDYAFGGCGRYIRPAKLTGEGGGEQAELPKAKAYEGMSQYKAPLCFELTGRRFEICLDNGYYYEVKFLDRKTLTWGFLEGEKHVYAYECLKGDEDTYYVNFELTGEKYRSCVTIILDTEQSLVTACFSKVGHNPRYRLLPSVDYVFGAIRRADGTLPEIRHGYTTDMMGKAICWRYGTLTIVHVYCTEHYYRLDFNRKEMERMMAENPERFRAMRERRREADTSHLYEDEGVFIKIKDGLYVFGALEALRAKQKGSGNSLFFLIDTKRVHDVGRSFGYNGDGEPENYTFGAFGEFYDASEMLSRKPTEFIR